MSSKLTAGDLQIISRIAVFRGLKPETVEHIIAPATAVMLRPHEWIVRQDEPATAFFIVIDGWIKLYRSTPSGDETVIDIMTKGQSFAEAVAFTGSRYLATVEAVSECARRTHSSRSYCSLHPRNSRYRIGDGRVDLAAHASARSASRAPQGPKRRAAGRRVSRIAVISGAGPVRIGTALRQSPDRRPTRVDARIAVACICKIEIYRRDGRMRRTSW